MKILYLNPVGQIGGAEAVLLDVLAGVRDAEPDWPLYLILGEPGPVAERASKLGVSVSILPFPPAVARLGDAGAGGPAGREVGKLALARRLGFALPRIWAYRAQLRRAIAEIQPDLLHSNGFKMHLLGLWSRPGKIPLIWHIHDYVSRRMLMAKLMKMSAGQCAVAVTNSTSVSSDLAALCPGLQVETVLNAIDLNRFSPQGPQLDLDQRAGLPPAAPGTIRVGLLATMARWKGHAVFLEALSKIPAEVPIRGYIVGGALYQTDGSQWTIAGLKALAASLGVADRVGFTGFTDQPASAMRALDIVVHASTDPEPFGLVIVEAMACGRAVIVSHAGGAAEIVREGIDALTHTPGAAAELAQRIEQLAQDASLRARLGGAGRFRAEKLFDRGRLAADLIRVYNTAAPSGLLAKQSLERERLVSSQR